MKLLFVNLSPLKFDVATPEREPLGGSESCVCYLARQLAQNGHEVTLAARLSESAPDIVMKVRHRPLAVIQDREFFAAAAFDAIIVCNAPFAAPHLRETSPASHILLWNHMLPDQPAIRDLAQPAVREALGGLVYVSAWQRAETEKVTGPGLPSFVIGNGLTPAFENMFASPEELLAAKQNRAAYTSTPFRGLELLPDIAEKLAPTEFDIFSSMQVYQSVDDPYRALYARIRRHPRLHHHGAVAQTMLARELRRTAFFAYPCIFPETYCLAALEAMAAGLRIVTSNLGALPDTTRSYADLVAIDGGKEKFVADFAAALSRNVAVFLERPQAWAEERFAQVQKVNRECLWSHRAKEWETLLQDIAMLDRAG